MKITALQQQSRSYPAAWNKKVPKTICMLRTVTSDCPWSLLTATEGRIYEVEVNPQGAVSALIDGDSLGLKPREFEIIGWH